MWEKKTYIPVTCIYIMKNSLESGYRQENSLNLMTSESLLNFEIKSRQKNTRYCTSQKVLVFTKIRIEVFKKLVLQNKIAFL